MIREPNKRSQLIEALSALIPEAQAETHAVDEAASARLGINRTDLRCLGVVLERGAVSPSKLAELVGLTRGAMTTALDRLETAGFIRRVEDSGDRRGLSIEPTATAKRAIREIWAPIGSEGLALLEKYKDEDLRLLVRFFEDYCRLQRSHAQRLRQSNRTAGTAASARGSHRPPLAGR
jgi:DNA-binding MarR family transcriptional regulator